jgi:peroxiredoxin
VPVRLTVLLALLALTGATDLGAATRWPDRGPAPELRGIQGWINSEPLTLARLRGKVVLVKFWTFACYNCRNTLTATQGWYDRHHADGLEIVSVHTPELEIERDPRNVEKAVRDQRITYPVALDPKYATWNAYDNHYWPAWYVIDARGRVRYVHIGEGAYDETERVIVDLLREARASEAAPRAGDKPSARGG